jgi:hypothetical protein
VAIFMFFLSFIVMLCLVSRVELVRSIRAFTLFADEPWSHDSYIYSHFVVAGGPGFGYM